MEEMITFMCNDLELEGLLDRNDEQKGVVITHPHPSYGGDMYSYVVGAIQRAYREKGYTTLRFNFRGVGSSMGSYDNGVGEREDVYSAISCLADMEIKKIDLAGYSFGAWVNTTAILADKTAQYIQPLQHAVLVSPPVGYIDFGAISSIDCLKLVITGSMDDVAPPDTIEKVMPQWNPNARLEVIDGADHFYAGYAGKLESILLSCL